MLNLGEQDSGQCYMFVKQSLKLLLSSKNLTHLEKQSITNHLTILMKAKKGDCEEAVNEDVGGKVENTKGSRSQPPRQQNYQKLLQYQRNE